VGTFLRDQLIYSVHFLTEDRLVGFREIELQRVWTPGRFEFRDRVSARVPLGIRGRVLVEPGEVGEILKVLRDTPGDVCYHVHFSGHPTLQVPETALEPIMAVGVRNEPQRS